jgi:chromosome segregation ATPase
MLNHWVATEQHLGLKVTKLVRDNNAGRVSFIALDKIPPQNGWRTPANSL